MGTACAIDRVWNPIVTQVALKTFCRASYNPMFLCRLSFPEPCEARVPRILDSVQSSGDSCFMNISEFRKLVVLQNILQRWKASRPPPHSVYLHEIISVLVQSVRAALSVHHAFVRRVCFEEIGLLGTELEYDVGNAISTLQRAWHEQSVDTINIKNVILIITLDFE